jgi:5-methylcytosine-specific restriction endonuclease McrA
MNHFCATRVAPEKAVFRPALPRNPFAGVSPERCMADKKSYWQLLRDPRWQRMRLEVMERANFECEICGGADDTLNVHHKIYRKGAAPWEYQAHELQCLCEGCHETFHDLSQILKETLAAFEISTFERVLGYARGLRLLEDVQPWEQDCASRIPPRIEMPTGAFASGFLDALFVDYGSQTLDALVVDKGIDGSRLWDLVNISWRERAARNRKKGN